MNILLVHGFLDRGTLFRRLRGRLESAGHVCFAPTLHPRDARHGIPDLAEKLSEYIDLSLPVGEPFAIVGFSMGCLISRYYLQTRSEPKRVRALFAISGPMHGTFTAWLYPGKGTRDMRPGSRFLRELNAPERATSTVQLHTYFTPLDLMIIPATSSRLADACELKVLTPLHRTMLWNPLVASDILKKLQEIESENYSAQGCEKTQSSLNQP
jgi:triacylglycerol lipase